MQIEAENHLSPVSRIANRLKEWLDQSISDGPAFEELRHWLKGHRLPAVGYDEEPYIWIQKALQQLPPNYTSHFTQLVVDFLSEQKPHLSPSSANSDKLLYNAFSYCSECGLSKNTSTAIFNVFNDAVRYDQFRGFLQANRVYNLKRALSEAFFSNTFATNELGTYIKAEATTLEQLKDREEVFRNFIQQIIQAMSDYPAWNELLIKQANRVKLQKWAAQSVEKIYGFPILDLSEPFGASSKYVLSKGIQSYLDSQNIEYECLFEGDILSKIQFGRRNIELLEIAKERVAHINKVSTSSTFTNLVKELSQEFFDLQVELKPSDRSNDDYAYMHDLSDAFFKVGSELVIFVEPNAKKTFAAGL